MEKCENNNGFAFLLLNFFSSKVSFLAFYCFSIISFKTKPKSDRSFIIESRLRFLRWHAAVFLIRFDFDSDPAMWFQSPGFWSLFRGKVSDLYGSGLGSATLLCSHARAFLYSLRIIVNVHVVFVLFLFVFISDKQIILHCSSLTDYYLHKHITEHLSSTVDLV